MSGPLLALTGVTARMTEGDLSARADVSRQDEFGALARSFNRMADQIQETITTLRRFVADAASAVPGLRRPGNRAACGVPNVAQDLGVGWVAQPDQGFGVQLASPFAAEPQGGSRERITLGTDGPPPPRGALKRPTDTQNLLKTGCSSAFSTHFVVSADGFNHRRGGFQLFVPNVIRSLEPALTPGVPRGKITPGRRIWSS